MRAVLLYGLAVGASACSKSGGGAPSPEAAAQGLFAAMKAGDGDTAAKLFVTSDEAKSTFDDSLSRRVASVADSVATEVPRMKERMATEEWLGIERHEEQVVARGKKGFKVEARVDRVFAKVRARGNEMVVLMETVQTASGWKVYNIARSHKAAMPAIPTAPGPGLGPGPKPPEPVPR